MEIVTMYEQLGVSRAVYEYGEAVLRDLRPRFDVIDQTAEYNQGKVLAAMQKNRVNATHFAATTGYGYNDDGRDNLERVYADVFHTEAALVRPQITCGTHALAVALSANLLPGDELLSPVGAPYDTLEEVIGIRPSPGSLREYGVSYRQVDLLPDGSFDYDGIRAAIQGNLAAIEAGRRPAVQLRPQYRPYQKYPRYTGFLALYVHYLYLLGKIGKRQYPPRMTPQLWQEVMRFEQYREQFAFLRDNGITTRTDMAAFTARTEETLANLMKQRTVLNVRRKRRRALYTALADAEALAPVKELYEAGLSGMETEFAQYMDAVAALEQCGVPREGLIQEKAELYDRLAELNRQIRAERRKLALCRKTQNSLPRMEQEIDKAEARESEVRTNEHRRR